MQQNIAFTATRDLYGGRQNIKTLRRELTRLSKVVPEHALITFEKVTSEANYVYTRIIARWDTYV